MRKILHCEVDQIAEGMEHDLKFQIYNGFVLWEQRHAAICCDSRWLEEYLLKDGFSSPSCPEQHSRAKQNDHKNYRQWQNQNMSQKTPSGVVLVLREASQLGTEKVPTLPSVIQSVSKQLKEILQLCLHDSSGTVWAEVVRTWSHPAFRTLDASACRVCLSPKKVSMFLGTSSWRQGYQARARRMSLQGESLLTALSPRGSRYNCLALPVPPGSSLGLRHPAKGFV